MMNQKQYCWKNRVLVLAGLLWSFSCISFFSLRDFDPLNRLYAAEDTRTGDDARNLDPAKERNRRYLAEMRRRANATKVYRLDEGTRTPVKMRPEPLFRFSNQPDRFPDGTVWAWGAEGRPVALQFIEYHLDERSEQSGFARCNHLFVSLSSGLVAAEWSDGAPWSAKKPGVHTRPLPNPPETAATKVRRLIQLKEIARRFSSTFTDNHGHLQELRFLPRPICRYSDPDSDVVDGAIFFYTVHGTSPELLVLIELRGENPADSTWEYDLMTLACEKFTVCLDEEEVWSWPGVWPPKQRFDSWLYFYGSDRVRL